MQGFLSRQVATEGTAPSVCITADMEAAIFGKQKKLFSVLSAKLEDVLSPRDRQTLPIMSVPQPSDKGDQELLRGALGATILVCFERKVRTRKILTSSRIYLFLFNQIRVFACQLLEIQGPPCL